MAGRRRGPPCCSWHRNQFVPAQSCSAHSLTLKALVMKGKKKKKTKSRRLTRKKEKKNKTHPPEMRTPSLIEEESVPLSGEEGMER